MRVSNHETTEEAVTIRANWKTLWGAETALNCSVWCNPGLGLARQATAFSSRRLPDLRKADAGGSLPQRARAFAWLRALPVRPPGRGTPAPSGDPHWRPIAI